MPRKLIFRTLTLFCFLITGTMLAGQSQLSQDLNLIQQQEKDKIHAIEKQKNRKRTFLISRDDSFIQKINPLRWTLGGLLYFYQTSISKHFSADCLYEPTCSNFSRDCIRHYGITKGVFLTADRLSRCNRIAQVDLHPLSINPKTRRSIDTYSIYQFKTDTCSTNLQKKH